jgi:hypothetical protein
MAATIRPLYALLMTILEEIGPKGNFYECKGYDKLYWKVLPSMAG